MKNILKIFIDDVKRIRKNVIAMIVVIGVLVVPCLYAWFNIAASWDPYNNTGNLKVAVASVDEGYTGSLIPLEINVGEQVISALRENTQMDWVFTSKEKAMEGVKSGQYYAAIVVPEKFSTQMMSLFSDQIQKPEIIYYSNAKENAIAPKVTDKGATAIQKQVNQVFIQTISDTAMTVFQSVSNMAEANGADRLVDNLIHNLEDASDDMDMTASTLETFSGITSSAQSLLNTSSDFLKELKTESADGKQILENSKKTFTDMKTTISSATESVGKALKAGKKVYSEMNLLLDQTVEDGINGSEDTVDTLVKAAKTVDKNIKSFTTLRDHLIRLSEKHPETDSSIGPMIEKINRSIEKQEELRDDLTDTAASMKKSTTGLISDKKALDALVKENQKRLQQISKEYENDVKGTLQKLADSVKDTSADLTGLTKQINASAKGVYTLTDTAGSDLSEIQTCLDDSGKLLRQSANKIKKITDKLTKAKDNGEDVPAMTSDFSFQVQEITRFKEAELNQELFDQVFEKGTVTSEEAFRNKIKEILAEQFVADSDYKFILDVRTYLTNKVGKLEYPDAFLKRFMRVSNADKGEKFVEENYDKSIEELTWHLIKEQLVKAYGIKVEKEDLIATAKNITKIQFAQYGMINVPEEMLDNYANEMLKKQDQVESLVNRSVENKLSAALKNVVKLNHKEISVEDFNKLFA